ncbi:flagellar hook-basal body complex protein [Clostridium sp. JS66]|uniref:flagellar hook-basal body complex protein n=1 Tax=Clostridium sp. JS66 TaxID=3064705 RepID=UPI00298E758C|nr:flagellar hook-basal body complex protein [Clostridium sp. JS66]WPC40994.1 flagellar hook-basal body complex protein [Clostridium sp. JS66]
MLPSMFSGISGLKVNQRKLDVIGNNIANSSTTAYKGQRARFEDMVSQNMAAATGASSKLGGTNPRQVGLGVQLAGIDTSTSQGSMQPTSNPLDAAIDGEGYFIVGTGAVPDGDTSGAAAAAPGTITVTDDANHAMSGTGVTASFTRDGSFTLDTQGSLLTSDGLRVYGYANNNVTINYADGKANPKVPFTGTYTPDSTTGQTVTEIKGDVLVPLVIPESLTDDSGASHRIKSYSIGSDGTITATLDTGTAVLGQIAMASFKNPAGLSKLGKNLYQTSPNSGDPVVRSFLGSTNDNSAGYGDVRQGMLEMSNVDLAEEFTNMIIANRAFQANGKIITTGDEILQDLVNLKR